MVNVSYDFSGQTAVVTGGSNGIGAEIVRRYQAAGAAVMIWDIAEPDVPLGQMHFCRVDLADFNSVEAGVREAVDKLGRIDLLSHNGGYAGGTMPVVGSDPEAWARIVDINLTGTYRVARAVVPVMLEHGFGRIINMASLAGKEGTPNASAYSAAKAGVIAFTKALAKELAETDIRVNSVAPAAVKTDILNQMTPEFVQIMIDKSPMKRLGTVEEVAEIVLWLSSTACTFNSGAVFDLSGGRATY